MAMNKKIILKWLLLFLLSGIYGTYLYRRPEVLNIANSVEPSFFYIIAPFVFFSYLSGGLLLYALLRFFNLKCSIKECIGLSSLATLGNYTISLGGGTFGKALYLKMKYDFPYTLFIATVSASRLIDLFLASFIGIFSVVFMDVIITAQLTLILWVFLVFGMALLLVIIVPFEAVKYEKKYLAVMAEILRGLELIKRDRALLAKICLLVFAHYMFIAIEIFYCFKAFSIDISMVASLLIVAVIIFSSVIMITPANVGIYEGGIAISAGLLGIGFDKGLLAAALSRAVCFVVTVFLVGVFGTELIRNRADS